MGRRLLSGGQLFISLEHSQRVGGNDMNYSLFILEKGYPLHPLRGFALSAAAVFIASCIVAAL